MLLHDNARLHSARFTQEEILDLAWSVLPYSSDLAPSDFYLFHSQQNAMNDKKKIIKIR